VVSKRRERWCDTRSVIQAETDETGSYYQIKDVHLEEDWPDAVDPVTIEVRKIQEMVRSAFQAAGRVFLMALIIVGAALAIRLIGRLLDFLLPPLLSFLSHR
jgi:hypothetical protein